MKRFLSLLLLSSIALLGGQERVDVRGLRLEARTEYTAVGADSNSTESFRFALVVTLTNISKSRLVVPTHLRIPVVGGGSSGALFRYVADFEWVDDRKIVPSEAEFCPVILEPGESAALPIYSCEVVKTDSAFARLQKIDFHYIVTPALAARFGWWSGEISTLIGTQPPAPNKSVEVTPTAVTPAADAPVAPSAGVPHH